MKTSNILITEPSSDYELLDSGEGEKLERFGKFVLSRPDPQSLWHKKLPPQEWKKADGIFSREENHAEWSLKQGVSNKWPIEFAGLKFYIKPTAFKHVGIFPEQSMNWEWLRDVISKVGISKSQGETFRSPQGETFRSPQGETFRSPQGETSKTDFEVLNLFGYTGGASLACAQAGAKVVHIDGSKSAIAWARENAEISGIADKPIRWILEDARTFVGREIKRERKYDGIIMDPPAFGHGPDNELWKIEDHFLPLIDDCMKILKNKPVDGSSGGPSFFLINGYSAGYSAVAYENILLPLVEKFGGKIEIGELAIKENAGVGTGRILPCGIFARWCKD